MKRNLKKTKYISLKWRQQNYKENFALLRKKYPEVARWVQNSCNGKATAVELESGYFAFLLQENGKRQWLTEPVNPKVTCPPRIGPTSCKKVYMYARGYQLVANSSCLDMPCYSSSCKRGFNCINEIEVERVYQKIEDLLERDYSLSIAQQRKVTAET